MSGVLRAELVRLRVRRFTWVVLVMVAVFATSVAVYAWREARNPTPAYLQSVAEQFQEDRAWWEGEGLARCEKTNDTARAAGLDPFDCDAMAPRLLFPPAPTFHQEGRSYLGSLAAPAVIGALLLGASLVTAEFGAGSMGLWLTFVAPRGRAFRAKVAAAGAGGALVGLVVGLVGAGGALVGFARRHRVGADVWSDVGDVAGVVGRLAVLGALAAVVGAGLGFALRHVAAVIGVALWWVLAVEVVGPLASDRLRPWTLGLNARAWVDGSATYTLEQWVPDPTAAGGLTRGDVDHVVGALQGGLLLAVVAAVVAGAGLVVFRLRDVS